MLVERKVSRPRLSSGNVIKTNYLRQERSYWDNWYKYSFLCTAGIFLAPPVCFVSQDVVSLPSPEIFSLSSHSPSQCPDTKLPFQITFCAVLGLAGSSRVPAKTQIFCNSNVPHLGWAVTLAPHLLLGLHKHLMAHSKPYLYHTLGLWDSGSPPCVVLWLQDNFIFGVLNSYHLSGRVVCSNINQ